MRKFLQTIGALIAFLFIVPVVSAEENINNNIHIHVELQEDGSAMITEQREAELYEDTELYIRLVNLQDSELLDFSVEGFTERTEWDIDDSFEEKAYHYGVLEVDDGYELAWGISEYGDQEYNLTYSLSNLVRELEDGQALLWNFDTFTSLPTNRLTFEISAPFMLEDEVLDFYGFGFEGPIEITDGQLEWTGYGLTEDNDVTVLLQFPPDTFQTSANVDMTLAEQREMATTGSSYNEDPPMPTWAKVLIGGFFSLLGVGAATGIAFVWKNHSVQKEYNHFFPRNLSKEIGDDIQKTPPVIEDDFGKYVALIRKVLPHAGSFTDYFFAYLIIWSEHGLITVESEEVERRFFGSQQTSSMRIEDFSQELELNTLSFAEYVELFKLGESTVEEVMWSILFEAADGQGVITGEDVRDWSYENAEEVNEFLSIMDEVSMDWLIENEYFNISTVKAWGMNVEIEEITPKGRALATEILQYNNFIKLIEKQQISEYNYWEELMIWAVLLGRGEDLVDKLEEFHPDTWDNLGTIYPYYYGNYYAYHYFYTNTNDGLSSAGYSGSGGGMSSVGGGAGAGGGGGGGSR